MASLIEVFDKTYERQICLLESEKIESFEESGLASITAAGAGIAGGLVGLHHGYHVGGAVGGMIGRGVGKVGGTLAGALIVGTLAYKIFHKLLEENGHEPSKEQLRSELEKQKRHTEEQIRSSGESKDLSHKLDQITSSIDTLADIRESNSNLNESLFDEFREFAQMLGLIAVSPPLLVGAAASHVGIKLAKVAGSRAAMKGINHASYHYCTGLINLSTLIGAGILSSIPISIIYKIYQWIRNENPEATKEEIEAKIKSKKLQESLASSALELGRRGLARFGSKIPGAIGDAVSKAGGALRKFGTSAGTSAVSAGEKAATHVGDALTHAGDAVKNAPAAASSFGSSVKTGLQKVGTSVSNAGHDFNSGRGMAKSGLSNQLIGDNKAAQLGHAVQSNAGRAKSAVQTAAHVAFAPSQAIADKAASSSIVKSSPTLQKITTHFGRATQDAANDHVIHTATFGKFGAAHPKGQSILKSTAQAATGMAADNATRAAATGVIGGGLSKLAHATGFKKSPSPNQDGSSSTSSTSTSSTTKPAKFPKTPKAPKTPKTSFGSSNSNSNSSPSI
jgi:hypothetical protein